MYFPKTSNHLCYLFAFLQWRTSYKTVNSCLQTSWLHLVWVCVRFVLQNWTPFAISYWILLLSWNISKSSFLPNELQFGLHTRFICFSSSCGKCHNWSHFAIVEKEFQKLMEGWKEIRYNVVEFSTIVFANVLLLIHLLLALTEFGHVWLLAIAWRLLHYVFI